MEHEYDEADDTVERHDKLGSQLVPADMVGLLTPVRGPIHQVVPIREAVMVLGREGAVDLPIQDSAVSRRHAEIRRRDEEFQIIDLGSRNGTYVDGVPVISCILRRGDQIEIGGSLFVFDWILEPREP